MAKRIKHAGIPRGNTEKTVEALTAIAETLTGAKGDGLEKAVTRRDLAEMELIQIARDANGRTFTVISNSSGGSTEDEDENVETPTAPSNFTATGAYSTITLSWDQPVYSGHSLTIIYRSEDDVFGNAVAIASTSFNIYGDAPGPGKTYYYWVRHVNRLDVQGPLNGTGGTLANTAADLDALFEIIAGMTAEVYLETYLNDSSALIDSISDSISDHESRLAEISGATDLNNDGLVSADERLVHLQGTVDTNKTETDAGLLAVTQGVTQNSSDIATLDSDYTQVLGYVTALENIVYDPTTGHDATRSMLLSEYYTSSQTDSAISTQVDTLSASIFDVTGNELSSAFTTKAATALVEPGNVLSNELSTLSSAANGAQADVDSLTQAVVNDTDGIITSHTDNYTIDVNGQSNTLQNWASLTYSVDGKFEAQWGAKSQVGDLANGFGLYNDGQNSVFAITAGQIVTVNPLTNQVSQLFSIIQNDAVIPDGVYINTAFIKAATIQELVAGAINADTVSAGISISSPVIDGGEISGSKVTIQAADRALELDPSHALLLWFGINGNLASKTAGNGLFSVANDGNIEMKGATIRDSNGNIILSSGGAIPNSAITGLSSLISSGAESAINLTYIQNLLANNVIAANVYAEKIEGELYNEKAYTLTPPASYTQTRETIATINVAGQTAGQLYDRVLKIEPLTIGWESTVSGQSRNFLLEVFEGATVKASSIKQITYGSAQGEGDGVLYFNFDAFLIDILGKTTATALTVQISANANVAGTVDLNGSNGTNKLSVAIYKNESTLS